jgi:hypothetical protein
MQVTTGGTGGKHAWGELIGHSNVVIICVHFPYYLRNIYEKVLCS